MVSQYTTDTQEANRYTTDTQEANRLVNQGINYYFLEDYPKAENFYRTAISLNPDLAEARCNNSWIFIDKNNYIDALKEIEEAIKIKPNYAEAYNTKGYIYLLEENFNEALKYFDEAIKLASDLSVAYYNRGLIYNIQHQYQEAISDFEKAEKLGYGDEHEALYMAWGLAEAKLQNYQEAVKKFSQGIKINDEAARLYDNRGYAYLMQKKYQKAEQDFKSAIDKDKYLISAYINYGVLLARQNKYEEAIKKYQNGGELLKELVDKDKVKMCHKTRYNYHMMLILKNLGTAYFHYGNVLFNQNDNKEASDNYQKSIKCINEFDNSDQEIKKMIDTLNDKIKNCKPTQKITRP